MHPEYNLYTHNFKSEKKEKIKRIACTVLGVLIVCAIFIITYVIAHNVSDNPFYNH